MKCDMKSAIEQYLFEVICLFTAAFASYGSMKSQLIRTTAHLGKNVLQLKTCIQLSGITKSFVEHLQRIISLFFLNLEKPRGKNKERGTPDNKPTTPGPDDDGSSDGHSPVINDEEIQNLAIRQDDLTQVGGVFYRANTFYNVVL